MRVPCARLFRAGLAISLGVSALLFFVWSWRWPLVGDASLIHYIGFLIGRGWAPYRDLGDMNMPGSFLIEMAAMHVFGMGDLGWRLFDFTLVGAAAAAFFAIAGKKEWLAGLFAASLFALIHGRDGLAEGGQRDLTMAVCLVAATAFLFAAVRRRAVWPMAVFGLLSGVAATIKPTSLPLTAVQLALAVVAIRRSEGRVRGAAKWAVAALLGYLVAPAGALVFLMKEHALAAFLAGFHGILPYYASLGHRPAGFVLVHSISPLLPLVLVWMALLLVRRPGMDWERWALIAGILFGLGNCLVQQRALPYYRYPLLVFLLPLMAMDFHWAFEAAREAAAVSGTRRRRAAGLLGVAGLAFGGFFLAPQSAVLIHRYRWWEIDFIRSLERNLEVLGGPALSGHIQCIDSISGCGNVLYRMRLEPATGVLSDFLLFGAVSDKQPPDSIPILRQTREQFRAEVLARPPRVIVVTSHLHMDGPDNFEKLERWPAFAQFLDTRYTLWTEWSPTRTARWWSREETPASYRIYVLRGVHP